MELKDIIGEEEYERLLGEFENMIHYGMPMSDYSEEDLKVTLVQLMDIYRASLDNFQRSMDTMRLFNEAILRRRNDFDEQKRAEGYHGPGEH